MPGGKRARVHDLLRGTGQQTAGLAHQPPIIFVGRAAQEADLVVSALGIHARPGEPVRAAASEQFLEEVYRVTT